MTGKIAHVVSLSIVGAKYCSVIQASSIILLGPLTCLTFVNIVHIYTLLKSKYGCYYCKTALKLEMLLKFAAFQSSLTKMVNNVM